MERTEAHELLKRYLKTKNLLKHTYAVEAVMRRLASHFGEDEEVWGLTGLLHDIDYDHTGDEPERHSLMGADILEEQGLDATVVQAVRAHNDRHELPRDTRMAHALYAVDPLTGLIVAAALIHPDKKLAAIDTPFVMNRFHEKSFARGARREAIESCSELGLELEEFVDLSLQAMQEIHGRLGL